MICRSSAVMVRSAVSQEVEKPRRELLDSRKKQSKLQEDYDELLKRNASLDKKAQDATLLVQIW